LIVPSRNRLAISLARVASRVIARRPTVSSRRISALARRVARARASRAPRAIATDSNDAKTSPSRVAIDRARRRSRARVRPRARRARVPDRGPRAEGVFS